jgi:hypothetical protein
VRRLKLERQLLRCRFRGFTVVLALRVVLRVVLWVRVRLICQLLLLRVLLLCVLLVLVLVLLLLLEPQGMAAPTRAGPGVDRLRRGRPLHILRLLLRVPRALCLLHLLHLLRLLHLQLSLLPHVLLLPPLLPLPLRRLYRHRPHVLHFRHSSPQSKGLHVDLLPVGTCNWATTDTDTDTENKPAAVSWCHSWRVA